MIRTVAEVMTAYPKSLSPEGSIRKAAQIMRDEDVGVLPIVDGMGVLVGIVTDRDIAVKAVADGRDADTPVEKCMTRNPDTIGKDTTLQQAMLLMSQQQIRRLPVVENGRLIGIVSLGDLSDSRAPEQEKAETLERVSAGPGDLRMGRPEDLT